MARRRKRLIGKFLRWWGDLDFEGRLLFVGLVVVAGVVFVAVTSWR